MQIAWQISDPFNGNTKSAVSCTNDLVFASATGSSSGRFYALNIKTGQSLWSHDFGSLTIGSPSISDGFVYFPLGYNRYITPKLPNTGRVMAFALPSVL